MLDFVRRIDYGGRVVIPALVYLFHSPIGTADQPTSGRVLWNAEAKREADNMERRDLCEGSRRWAQRPAALPA